MSTATSVPHEGDLPSLGTHTGLPLWFFLEHSLGCCSSWKEGQFHMEYVLGVDDCPPLELPATISVDGEITVWNVDPQLAAGYLTKSVGVPLRERHSMTKEGEQLPCWLSPRLQ